MAPGHLPFNLAIRIGQLARGPLGRPEDSELVVHHLLDRFTGADLTETLSRIEGTERESVSEGSAAIPVFCAMRRSAMRKKSILTLHLVSFQGVRSDPYRPCPPDPASRHPANG